MKAIGYVRVSSDEQVRDGVSLERQIEQIKGYAKRKKYKLQIVKDNAISGHRIKNRPGIQKVIDLCKSKAIDIVIVYDLSRLSRSVKETLILLEDVFQKNKIEFVSLQNEIDTTTPMGKAFLQFTAMMNEMYRNEISWKTKAALDHKRKKGEKTGGDKPYGYDVDSDGKLVRNEAEMNGIDYMKELKGQGLSLNAIARKLTEQGMKTKNGLQNWQAIQVKRCLNNGVHYTSG